MEARGEQRREQRGDNVWSPCSHGGRLEDAAGRVSIDDTQHDQCRARQLQGTECLAQRQRGRRGQENQAQANDDRIGNGERIAPDQQYTECDTQAIDKDSCSKGHDVNDAALEPALEHDDPQRAADAGSYRQQQPPT